MRDALWSELLKARRSRLPWLTALAFTLVTLVCGLFMFILADPARARALGLLGDKAQLSGAVADWPGYLAGRRRRPQLEWRGFWSPPCCRPRSLHLCHWPRAPAAAT